MQSNMDRHTEINKLEPCFIPTLDYIKNTNIYKFMRYCKCNSYAELHTWSYTSYEAYWQNIIKVLGIKFQKQYSKICTIANIEAPQWLVGAKLNITDSCVNIHNKSKPAILWQQENTDTINTTSYQELEALTNKVANGLKQLELNQGDAVAIDMAMTAEAVALYLGIIKAGLTVVSIADSFAAEEIQTRLEITNTKLVFTQDYLVRAGKKLPLYAKVVQAKAPLIIVLPSVDHDIQVSVRKQDITWHSFLQNASTSFVSVSCNPHDHINILFSSGTTGAPKAIPWNHTSAIKAAADGHLHQDITPRDIIAWPTNLGWMMGPWLIFAALINKATIALYYGAPNTAQFVKFIENSHTTILGVVPSLVKTWKSNDYLKGVNWDSIKLFSSTGESSNNVDMSWLAKTAGGKPIIEYCGGTEIAGGYLTSTVVQPNIPGCFSTKALGLNFCIIDENGKATHNGEVAIIPPSMGLSVELLNKDHHEVYYAGMPKLHGNITLRRHGDQIEQLANGYYRALGRVDDTMNLGGIKTSSAEIERVLLGINNVVETAAIAVSPKAGGPSNLVIYAVVEAKNNLNLPALTQTMQNAIKEKLNPLFKIAEVIIIDNLPRTSSNKIMRRTLREQYQA